MIDVLKNRTLVISPHPDDEVLGCGGILDKCDDKKNLHILYMTSNHPLFSKEEYDSERKNVCDFLMCNTHVNKQTELLTNKLDTLPISAIISDLEKKINEIKPNNIFVCFPSYNQDHRIIFDATITATRPHDKNWFVNNIFVYEQPETLHSIKISTNFVPNSFFEININNKIKLYNFYKSQLRGHRSTEAIIALAKLRGSFINKEYAEAFQVVRFTNS